MVAPFGVQAQHSDLSSAPIGTPAPPPAASPAPSPAANPAPPAAVPPPVSADAAGVPPPAPPGPPEPPPALSLTTEWCSLPLCKEAEDLRRSGDLASALKLFRYIQDEVDVGEAVVRKPLLWFPIALLYRELDQPQAGMEALNKYQLYMAAFADTDLPSGQRRVQVDQLAEELRSRMGRVRIASKTPGLRILVDGKQVGTTPIKGALPVHPGLHRVEIVGATTESQDVDVPSGNEVLIWPMNAANQSLLGLTGQPTPSRGSKGSDRLSRPAWRIALGTVGLGAGVTMIGLGAASLASDGRCVDGAASGPCPVVINGSGQPVTRVVDGRTAGGVLLATGLLAAGAASVLIALPPKRHLAALRASVHIHDGASLALAASF